MIVIEENDKGDSEWNNRLLSSNLGIISQAREVSEHYVDKGGIPKFLKFLDDNKKIIGQLLIVEYPRFNSNSIKQNLVNFPGIKKSVFEWVYGPTIFDNQKASEVYKVLGHYLISKKCRVSGWQHPLSTNGINGIGKNFKLKKWGTFLIDLNQELKEIYKKLDKHSAQKNIERANNRGVKIEEINENNIPEFFDVYLETHDDGKSRDEYCEDQIKYWKIAKPLGLSGFLAKKNNQAVGGLFFSYFNKHILEGGVARSHIDTKYKLYSQDLIKWKIIEWGVENKMRFFNLAGFNPNPESEKEKGIYRYKKKWGGQEFFFSRISL